MATWICNAQHHAILDSFSGLSLDGVVLKNLSLHRIRVHTRTRNTFPQQQINSNKRNDKVHPMNIGKEDINCRGVWELKYISELS